MMPTTMPATLPDAKPPPLLPLLFEAGARAEAGCAIAAGAPAPCCTGMGAGGTEMLPGAGEDMGGGAAIDAWLPTFEGPGGPKGAAGGALGCCRVRAWTGTPAALVMLST